MRQLAALALVLACFTAGRAAHAMGPFGPPGPTLTTEQGNSLEIGYFTYRSTWDPSSDERPVLGSVDIEQAHAYLQATLGATEDGEWFARAGGADFKETTAAGSFNSGARPFFSTGIRGAVFSVPKYEFCVGVVAQGSIYASYSDTRRLPSAPSVDATADVHSYFDVSLAVAAQERIAGRIVVYAGPYVFYSQAQGHVASAALGRDVKTQFKDNRNFGLVAGTRIDVWKGLGVDAEMQAKGSTSYGAKVSYSF